MESFAARLGRRTIRRALLTSAVVAASLAAPSAASATLMTVETTADSEPGVCTLRAAITAASTDSAGSGCPAGSSTATDQIVIDTSGNIMLASALPELQGAIEISGRGTDQTALTRNDGAAPFPVFEVDGSGIVVISGVQISNGLATGSVAKGGGILNFGDLTLTNVVLSENDVVSTSGAANAAAYGGGVYSEGGAKLRIIRSYIGGNTTNATSTGITEETGQAEAWGAAIFAGGPLTLRRTTVINNSGSASSPHSGYVYGTVVTTKGGEVTNSTINHNTANATGDSAAAFTFGSALVHIPSGSQTLELDQSTIANNFTFTSGTTTFERGTIALINGGAQIHSSTIALNDPSYTSGIYQNAPGQDTKLKNTIIADPEGASQGNCKIDNGTITSQGFNLIEGGGCITPLATDKTSDPELGSLADNGAATQTLAPSPTSPAVDAGIDATGLTTDQRGEARPRDMVAAANATGGDGTDIGAYERQTTVFTPKELEFGVVDAEDFSSSQEVIAATTDTSIAFTFGTLALVGANPDDFQITDDDCSGLTLDDSPSSCKALVAFAPDDSTPGVRTAKLQITDDVSSSPISVTLTGSVPDLNPPVTSIVGFKLKKTTATLRFSYTSTEEDQDVFFECSLDGKPFKGCVSPKVYKRLKVGRHVFKVRARDDVGNVDATPAVKRFKVLKPNR